MTTKGMRVWVRTLLEYDEFGMAKVMFSHTMIAKDSAVQKGAYQKKSTTKPKEVFKKFEVTKAEDVESGDIL